MKVTVTQVCWISTNVLLLLVSLALGASGLGVAVSNNANFDNRLKEGISKCKYITGRCCDQSIMASSAFCQGLNHGYHNQ